MKNIFGDNQYVVYAKNSNDAKAILKNELQRFDNIKEKMANLFTKDGRAYSNFMTNISEENLNIYMYDNTENIYDDPRNALTKGEVRQRSINNGNFKYDLAYRYQNIQGCNANFRLAHEMGHLVLNPSTNKYQKQDKDINSTQVAGLIRQDNNKNNEFYGLEMQENAINLLGQLAIRGNHSADDIISGKVDVSEFNNYRKVDDLVKLLAVSMRNDYEKEISFEELANGKLDSLIQHNDGSKEPANTFFYGLLNDSNILEKEFDKYLGPGAWKQLDSAITALHSQPNVNSPNFEQIYNASQDLITDFAKMRMQEKYKEANERNVQINEFGEITRTAIPNLDKKLEFLSQTAGKNIELSDISIEDDIPTFSPPKDEDIKESPEEQEYKIEDPQTDTEEVLNSKQHNSNVPFKEKMARIIGKNNLLMKIPFLKSYVGNNTPKALEGSINDTHKLENNNDLRNNLTQQVNSITDAEISQKRRENLKRQLLSHDDKEKDSNEKNFLK